MIRPFTVISMVLACASGLYLYQSKHQAQMLDRDIGRTLKQTEQARERIGMLRTEWALVNEPDRLAELARAHTSLQPLKPTQFVAMADLAARLPAPGHAAAEPEPEEIPVAQASPVPTPAAPAPETKAEPKPEPRAVAAAEPKPAPRHVTKTQAPTPVTTQSATDVADTSPAREPGRAPVHVTSRAAAPSRQILPASVNADATAPGTVGAAVLRAMRAQGQAQQAYTPPAYAQPAYAQPAYQAPQAYAAPAASMLGNARGALPPPVPYASR